MMSKVTGQDLQKAIDKMENIAARWFATDHILLGVWSMIEKNTDKDMKTMGLDTKSEPPCLRYNPIFINSLEQETLEMVLGAECIKILLRHPTTRLKDPKHVSGLSSSITVDQIVMKDIAGALKDIIPMPKNYGIEELNSNHERYFRLLMEKFKETEKQMDKQFGKNDGNEEKDDKSNSGGQSGDGEDGDEEGEGQSSGGSSEGEGDFQDFKNAKDAMKKHMDPRNGQQDHWGDNEMLDAEVQNFVHQNKGSSKMWGSMSADFLTQIVAANTPKISWKEVLRRFNTSVQTHKTFSTRMKYNRRMEWEAPGRRRINTTKILFALDVSGSMSDEDIAEGFAVVNSVCRHAIVHWMTFDTEIKQIETKMKHAQNMFKVCGRGGTDPNPVLRYAEEHCYDGVVIYSDLDFYGEQKPPKRTKVLWLGADKRDTNPTNFGFFAKLDRD